MSTKNLFDKAKSRKVLSSVDPATIGLDAESHRNIKAKSVEKNRFIPNVDFSSASNFVRYGSAKKYYESAFDRIVNEYPYDGSSAEKQEFINSSSYLDLYVLENKYPTTTGYATISSDGWGTISSDGSALTGGYGLSDSPEYIRVVGGPHTASSGMSGKTIHSTFSSSNIYDSDIYDTEGVLSLGKQGTRESNLKFDLPKGVSTEFWFNKGTAGDSEDAKASATITIPVDRVDFIGEGDIITLTATDGTVIKCTLTGVGGATTSAATDGNVTAETYAGSTDNTLQATAQAVSIATAINNSNYFTATNSTNVVTVTQAFAGYAGNTNITVTELGTAAPIAVTPFTGGIGTSAGKHVLLDLWNGAVSSSVGYGRLLVEYSGSTDGQDPFSVHLASGSNVWDIRFGGSTTTTSSLKDTWNHVAFSFLSSSTDSQLQANFYLNGKLQEGKTNTTITSFKEVTGSLIAHIGALQTSPSGNVYHNLSMAGYGKLSGSLDDFRYWKTARTHEEIAKNYFKGVHGGTNTDISNTELGVYYKFNEGVTTNSAIDATVLDYSGRLSNGNWVGYPAGTARNTGSAIVSSSAAKFEEEDPIIYPTHSDVASARASLVESGSAYDFQNNSSIYYTLPTWIIEEDDENGEILNLTQIMASYLDTLHAQISELPNLKNINYLSSSHKPYPFSARALESVGLFAPEVFVDATVLEQFAQQSETEHYEKDLSDIKNLIYKNIYNNLAYIYKSKGTEKSFRNIVRCYGVDDELIKINLYGNNVKHKFRENYRTTAVKKNYIDFNHPDRFGAVVTHQSASGNTNTSDTTYISGSTTSAGLLSGSSLARTAEIEVIFPKKLDKNSLAYFDTNFVTASIFGHHRALVGSDLGDFKWASAGNDKNFEVYAIRPFTGSNDAYFVMTDRGTNFRLTSSIYQDVYNDQKWNFAVRTRASKFPHTDRVSGSNDNGLVEFFGCNVESGIVKNEFSLTASVTNRKYLDSPRRYYMGAHRDNFTGSIRHNSDLKISSLRHWESYLTDDEIRIHAKDAENYGVTHPFRNAYLYSKVIEGEYIPKIETLALHWNFDDVTGSDANGRFLVNDFSSGSILKRSRYTNSAKFGDRVGNQYTGRGYFFDASSTSPVSVEYVQSLKQSLPEVVTSYDMTNILDFDDETFVRDSRTVNHFFAIEKSMYQTISEEMLNMFATIVDFNNLIGEPVNRYRQEYKDMSKLRNLFFERVGNVPDLDKYLNFYRWIDDSLSTILNQIIPASANTSEGVFTVIESHVLERNKYHNKFPTLEMKSGEIIGGVRGVNTFEPDEIPNWRHAHAPVLAKATATISVADGDAANGMTEKEHITLTSTDGITKRYVITNAASDGSTATGTVLSDSGNTDTGAGTAGADEDGGIAVSINLSSATQNAFLVQLKAAIEHANGHNGKIIVSAVPTEADGSQSITLTQSVGGDAGNTTITTSISQVTESDFTGGESKQQDNTIWWQYAEATHPALSQSNPGVNATRTAIINSKRNARVRKSTTPYKISMGEGSNYEVARAGTGRRVVHKGSNLPRNKRTESFKSIIKFGSDQSLVFDNIKNVIDVNDVIHPMHKKYQAFEETNNNLKGESYAPFRVLSGSSTGYNAVFSGLQVVNLHSDSYLDSGEEPIQSPFTRKFVGGHASRHTPINSGSDTYLTRAESWKLTTTSTSVTIEQPDTHNPRDAISRNVKAKRPVNIENLRITGSNALGNYSNIREVVLVSGRAGNNSQFVRNEGVTLIHEASTEADGLNDHKITELSSSGHIITERFSSPGGFDTSRGALDLETGQFSVYNALPYRNLSVRTPLRTMLSGTTSRFGFKDSVSAASTNYSGKANFHKVHRNTHRRLYYSTAGSDPTVASASIKNNAFFSTPIPQSDLQYTWVTGAYQSTNPGGLRPNKMLGYAPRNFEVSTSSGHVNAITFMSHSYIGADKAPADFVGLNTLVVEPVSSSEQVLGHSLSENIGSYITTNFGSVTTAHGLSALLAHRGSVYGFNTWKQIRTGEHPLARKLRNTHIISVESGDNQGFTAGRVLPAQRYGRFTQYRESPVVTKYKPVMQHVDKLRISSTYGNNVSRFSNLDLNEIYAISPTPQVYDSIKGSYEKGEIEFGGLRYGETVYPAEKNVFDNRIRIRKDYAIDFWHSDRDTRTTNKGNKVSLGGNSFYSIWALDAPSSFSTMAVPDATDDLDDPPGELQNKKTHVHNGTKTAITASALYALPHMMASTASVVAPSGVDVAETGSGAASGTNIYNLIDIGTGNTLWEAGTQAGRMEDGSFVASHPDRQVPAYDSYEDYAEELRLKNKDFSIVPEFRISDHISYYVKKNNGDFLANDIFGATGSADYPTDSGYKQFYNVYTNSDFLKYFDIIKDEHTGMAREDSITLKCKALMKFLPYNGFYPAERTLQMASQYSASYAKHVGYSGTDSTYENAKIRPFLEPMFAPGIVYNSIKSGIGVPYPVLTGSFSTQKKADYYALSSSAIGSTFRMIDFEAAVQPEKYLSEVTLHDMQPHPSGALDLTASWNGNGDPLYSMMANNFFGEVPEFFLPQGNLTTIVSLPESDPRFGNAVNTNVYGMRVKMYRSMNRAREFSGLAYNYPQDSPVQDDLHETFTMYSRPTAFFHAVSGRSAITRAAHESATYGSRAMDGYNGYNWVATPPYYHGEAWVDILFTAAATKKHTLDEILSNIGTTVELRLDNNSISIANNRGYFSNGRIRDNILNVTDTLILDGRARVKSVEYDPDTGQPVVVKDDPTANHVSYVIQPKWETPMFNFNDRGPRPITNAGGNLTVPTNGKQAVARGMWHQFGLPPDSPEKGVFLQVTDIPKNWLDNHPGVDADNYNNGDVKSLVDLLGIDPTPRRLGEIASNKTVSEAIVAVPFIEDGAEKRFFSIHKKQIAKAMNGKLEEDNSVRQMVEKMQKYVFPPKMDFITCRHVEPFAMYIFEFEHEFDKDDLIHMWQNLPPKSVSKMEQKETTVSHKLLSSELLATDGLPSKVKWMVFKVKKKAVKNYYSKTASKLGTGLDDKKFKFQFEIAGRTQELDYSYNWPYDFFSLVEMVKIDAEVEFKGEDK